MRRKIDWKYKLDCNQLNLIFKLTHEVIKKEVQTRGDAQFECHMRGYT